MKKIVILLLVINFVSCDMQQKQPIEKQQESVVAKKPKMVTIAIEDVIATLTVENSTLLISELEKPHKHNDFVTIETSEKNSPINIIFEDINGKNTYTGVKTYYNKKNEKKEDFFTTLTESQLNKLKETGETGWKD